jgi:hypothetical protein
VAGKVVLAFDGSASGDSTALIGCTLDGHLFVVGIWQHPPNDERWRVPRLEVDEAVALAFDRFDVVELACDPWCWRSEIESWSKRHGRRRVVEYNTGAAQRMAPATDRLYQGRGHRPGVPRWRRTPRLPPRQLRGKGDTIGRLGEQGQEGQPS